MPPPCERVHATPPPQIVCAEESGSDHRRKVSAGTIHFKCFAAPLSPNRFELQILLEAVLSRISEGPVVTQPYDATEFANIRVAT